jgi:hypothetical protein
VIDITYDLEGGVEVNIEEMAVEVGVLKERISNIEDNFHKCQKNEEYVRQDLTAKYDQMIHWLIGLFGTTIVSLVLLIFNLLKR